MRLPSCINWPGECKSVVKSTEAGKIPPRFLPSLSPANGFHLSAM